jgi:hypothetical protein
MLPALTPGHSATAQLSGDPSFRPDPENFDLLEQNYETLGTGTSGLPAYRETHPQFPGLYCISRVPLLDDSITRVWKTTWAGFLNGAAEKGKATHITREYTGDDITIDPVYPAPGPTRVSLPQLAWTVRYISLTPPKTENVGLGNHLNSPSLTPRRTTPRNPARASRQPLDRPLQPNPRRPLGLVPGIPRIPRTRRPQRTMVSNRHMAIPPTPRIQRLLSLKP